MRVDRTLPRPRAFRCSRSSVTWVRRRRGSGRSLGFRGRIAGATIRPESGLRGPGRLHRIGGGRPAPRANQLTPQTAGPTRALVQRRQRDDVRGGGGTGHDRGDVAAAMRRLPGVAQLHLGRVRPARAARPETAVPDWNAASAAGVVAAREIAHQFHQPMLSGFEVSPGLLILMMVAAMIPPPAGPVASRLCDHAGVDLTQVWVV